MGTGYVRCQKCEEDDCCKLWHAVVEGKLYITAGEDPEKKDEKKKCKEPCKCFVVRQKIDDKDKPKKVFEENWYPGDAGKDIPGHPRLTPSDYYIDVRGVST